MGEAVIPTEWVAALEGQPEDLTLRRALADWFLEQGDELAAEALRWSAAKGVTPKRYDPSKYEVGWTGVGPPALVDKTPYAPTGPPAFVSAFVRLIGKWKNSTPAERADYWRWEPT